LSFDFHRLQEKAADTIEALQKAGIKVWVEPVLLDVFSHDHQFSQPNGEVKHMHFIGIIHRLELPLKEICKEDGDGFSSDGTRWFDLN